MNLGRRVAGIDASLRGIVTLVGKNSGARVLTLPLTAGVNLLIAHVILASIGGMRGYALYTVLLSIVALLSILDLGVGAALTNRFADEDSVRGEAIEAASVRVQTLLGVFIAVVAATGAALGWLDKVTGLSGNGDDAYAVLAILLTYSLTLPLNLASSVMLGSGRSHIVVLCQSTSAPIAALGITSLARFSETSAVMAIALGLACGIVTPRIVISFLAFRAAGFHVFRTRYWSMEWKASFRTVLQTSVPMLVVVVTQPMALQSDRLILGHISGAAEVAQYGLAHQFYMPIYGVLSASGLALWPYLRRVGSGAADLKASRWALSIMGLGGGVALVVLAPVLMDAVAGGRIEVSRSLIVAFAGLLVVQSVQLPLGMLFTSPYGLRLQAKQGAGMLVTNLLLTVLAAHVFGAVGCVLASIVSIAVWQVVPLHLLARRGGGLAGRA